MFIDGRIKADFSERVRKINDPKLDLFLKSGEDRLLFLYNNGVDPNAMFQGRNTPFKPLFPQYFKDFKAFSAEKREKYGGALEEFSEMAFIEYAKIDFSKWDFLDDYFTVGKRGYGVYGVSAYLIEKYHKNTDEIVEKFRNYPLAVNLFFQVLMRRPSEKTYGYVTDCVKSAGLQDSYRFYLFRILLKDYRLETLDYFTKTVIENKFTRFKSLKEAMCYDDLSYVVQFTSEEYIKILRAVAVGDYEKYIFTPNGAHRLLAVDAVMKYRADEFSALMKKWAEGDENLRRTVFYIISKNGKDFPEFLKEVSAYSLSVSEAAAFLQYYRLQEISLGKDLCRRFFYLMLNVYDAMEKVRYTFTATDAFPVSSEIGKDTLVSCMVELSAKMQDKDSRRLLEERYDNMPLYGKSLFLEKFRKHTSLNVTQCALEFLKGDESVLSVYKKLNIKLTYEQAVYVSDFLKSKKQSVKQNILKEYLKSPHAAKISEYLLSRPESYKQEIGAEMRKSMKKVNGEILNKKEERKYYYASEESVLTFEKPPVRFKTAYAAKPLAAIKKERVTFIFEEIIRFLNENKDYEYKPYYEIAQKLTLGSRIVRTEKGDGFSALPLGEKFKEIFQKLTSREILELNFLNKTVNHYSGAKTQLYLKVHDEDAGLKEFMRLNEKYPHAANAYLFCLIQAAVEDLADEDDLAEYVLQLALHDVKYDDLRTETMIPKALLCEKDENILKILYAYENAKKDGFSFSPGYRLIAKAYERKLVGEEYLEYLLVRHAICAYELTNRAESNKDYLFNTSFPYPKFREFYLKIILKYVSLELERGTLKTPYSNFVMRLQEIYGTEIFVKAIVKLRGLTLVRYGDYFYYGEEKNEVLSKILKCARPKESETYADFKKYVQEYGITKEELIRAVVYNQNFLNFGDEYLQIPGFKSAVLYFSAHLNETLSTEKIEKIKEYSTIDYHDFKDGAFDFAWYEEMIRAVPPKDFKLVYDNAKYITVAGLHKRAQRFFDALNGKITVAEAKEKILKTRNKDYCLIYSLIPLEGEKDTDERYLFLTDFLKESKKYGAARQLSERRTVDIALDNLARNAGYEDTSIFIYETESKDRRVVKMYEGIEAEGYGLKLILSGDKVKLQITGQNGKTVQKLPAAISKIPAVAEIVEYRKSEENKRKRLKKSLEEAMEEQTPFSFGQIAAITQQPLIRSFFERLILTDGKAAYAFEDGKIVDITALSAAQSGTFTIAHPVLLKELGVLGTAMKYVVARNIRQPFKQVFREMYLLSDGEREADEVLRYKGFNVDLKKAVAALKNRGWGVSEDIGLRKVYYRRNAVAAIFREFDYYYIYDFQNENRELESVLFLNRKDFSVLPLDKVDSIVFSETLRDVDLMIALSANNAYDYSLSMSTFEMRRAMIESIAEILAVKNITFLKENVKVEGVYGTYVINIRTGLVFKEGKGNLLLKTIENYDKPLALDFIDEDPVTADIVTKILILSADSAIKDGSILKEIAD